MEKNNEERLPPKINIGYPHFQIAKALSTLQEHSDEATRLRAFQKILRWQHVVTGMLQGRLGIGSRTPVKDAPPWVTLEVVTGGFATGRKLAGGPLLEHEAVLLQRIGQTATGNDDARRVLNSYYLTDDGLAELQALLRSRRHEITVPEEGALLVIAWLAENGFVEEARSLVEDIGSQFSELRFYPVPIERSKDFGSQVALWTVGQTTAALSNVKPNLNLLVQKQVIEVSFPLYDRMVELFLESVDGDTPALARGINGERVKPVPGGRFPIIGGWPCKRYPEGWQARAAELVDAIEQSESRTGPSSRKKTFRELYAYLQRCLKGPQELTGRDVGRIRCILAGYVDKRGNPQSAKCREARNKQSAQVTAPLFCTLALVLTERLKVFPKDEGLNDTEKLVVPVDASEAEQFTVALGSVFPPSLKRKIERCLAGTVELLVAQRIITSTEVLARLMPQITAGRRAAALVDPDLRHLYSAIYRAFRQRRSVLLLNLQSQVRIEELPWVAAIDRHRKEAANDREAARQTLEEITSLSLGSFPYMILPNKLVKELRALCIAADLGMPLLDELAADIFMRQFGVSFVRAAKIAGRVLKGTLYATYFGIDYDRVRELAEPPDRKQTPLIWREADEFAQFCMERAGVSLDEWSVAANGMIIEQQQITTTQNLAVLYDMLGIRSNLQERSFDLAKQCFTWICRRQTMKITLWHAQLVMLKNTAYAWRQMVFFLSLLPPARVQEFLGWAGEHLNRQPPKFQTRFMPVLNGLTLAAHGVRIEDGSTVRHVARRFFGWSKERHWLLD